MPELTNLFLHGLTGGAVRVKEERLPKEGDPTSSTRPPQGGPQQQLMRVYSREQIAQMQAQQTGQ